MKKSSLILLSAALVVAVPAFAASASENWENSCASCHGEDGKRIRLQDLPNLTSKAGAQKGYTTWPAYRVSQGELRSFQWRLNDCFRQQRFPEPIYGSDVTVALSMFMAATANGAVMNTPGIKR